MYSRLNAVADGEVPYNLTSALTGGARNDLSREYAWALISICRSVKIVIELTVTFMESKMKVLKMNYYTKLSRNIIDEGYRG